MPDWALVFAGAIAQVIGDRKKPLKFHVAGFLTYDEAA